MAPPFLCCPPLLLVHLYAALYLGTQPFWSDQFPGHGDVHLQLRISDPCQFDTYPPPCPHIGWPEKVIRRAFDQPFLEALWYWKPNRNMSIVMMVVREHHKDLLANEERGLTM